MNIRYVIVVGGNSQSVKRYSYMWRTSIGIGYTSGLIDLADVFSMDKATYDDFKLATDHKKIL
ncbi:hypothetical protein ABE15_09855 [Bacillus cereus]|nr:hypothetical protein [Bacillus cereus]